MIITEKEKKPYSLTPIPSTKELTELEKIKAQMLSDVAVALIGCCATYPYPHRIAQDAKRIVELCFSEGEEAE